MLAVDKDTFQDEVLDAYGYVIVDYWSDGCKPCNAIIPDLEELEEKYKGKVKFTKLNTAKSRRLAILQEVIGLPTIALYKAGEKIDEVTKEEATKENIKGMIGKYID